MLHEHHYTREQASALRDWVTKRVWQIREAHEVLGGLGESARTSIAALDPLLGGTYPGRALAQALVQLSRAATELDAADIVVRDPGQGLVDFPAIRDGQEVYLCWLLDEDDVGFWHEPSAGFAGRQPL